VWDFTALLRKAAAGKQGREGAKAAQGISSDIACPTQAGTFGIEITWEINGSSRGNESSFVLPTIVARCPCLTDSPLIVGMESVGVRMSNVELRMSNVERMHG
jgi:hypothetical protein